MIVTTLLAAAILPGNPAAKVPAPALAEVGVVAEYRPATGRFVIERGADRVPVRIGTLVHAGDRVVLPAGAAIVVQLATGKPLVLERNATVAAAPTLGKLASFFRSIPALFDSEFRQARTAASRGGGKCEPGTAPAPLDVPVLVPDAAIAAGTRDVPLVWRGGCSPYAVLLLRGADTIASRRDIETGRIRLDSADLRPGRHLLVFIDGAGRRLEAGLEVVPSIPELPAEIATDPTELGIIAQAIWLAEQDGGRWRFDSFERLRPLVRAGNPLAGTIADGLLWGRKGP